MLHKHPVFFIQVKSPSSFCLDSNRKQADDQMRDHFHELSTDLITPRLPAISAFGTRIAVYEYTATTNTATPPANATDPTADLWNYDVLEADGIAKMCQVIQDVRVMTEALVGN
jgi:hypothetical protein